jgi:hypothetical protein
VILNENFKGLGLLSVSVSGLFFALGEGVCFVFLFFSLKRMCCEVPFFPVSVYLWPVIHIQEGATLKQESLT